jgi:hypothetical protein
MVWRKEHKTGFCPPSGQIPNMDDTWMIFTPYMGDTWIKTQPLCKDRCLIGQVFTICMERWRRKQQMPRVAGMPISSPQLETLGMEELPQPLLDLFGSLEKERMT